MKDKIAACVEQLFAVSERNGRSEEAKEELILNLCDKYDDLVSQGYAEEAAYYKVISGIGDIDELIDSVRTRPILNGAEINQRRNEKKRETYLLLRSIAIFMYITCFLPLIFLSSVLHMDGTFGVLIMFAMIGAATCLIVYSNSGLKTLGKNYDYYHTRENGRDYINIRYDNTGGENSEVLNENKEKNPVKGLIISIMWTMIVLLYLLISFTTMRWDITWLIFLLGSIATIVIDGIYYLISFQQAERQGLQISIRQKVKKITGMLTSALWLFTVIFYFVISLETGIWTMTWLIFIVAAALTQVIALLGHFWEGRHYENEQKF
ncbi:MAG: permease prefix domain 1-containing protein [Oscillospiraceae bacterium]|jgi:hypothetical protein|nr:permease prefix domain 1-containing protein [Oscillospiraceae bacterium]